MFYRPVNLYYKCVFDVSAKYLDDGNVFNRIMDIIEIHLQESSGIAIDRADLERYGHFSSRDNSENISIASHHLLDGESLPFLWAMKLFQHDPENRRRTWVTHIGIHQNQSDQLFLYFALCYSDNMAGSLSLIRKPVRKPVTFIEFILQDEWIQCCTGNYVLPLPFVHTNFANVSMFYEILHDPERKLPVVFITCPTLVDPYGLNERLKGNAVIFSASDPGVIMEINNDLDDLLRLDYDSIRIYLPIDDTKPVRHPILTTHTITELTPPSIVNLLALSFSESLRSEERNAFITTDYIISLRESRKTERTLNELEQLKKHSSTLTKQLKSAEQALNEKAALCDELKSTQKAMDMAEYEALLNDCLTEIDDMKMAVRNLTEKLYQGRHKEICEGIGDGGPLSELEVAIHSCIVNKYSRGSA